MDSLKTIRLDLDRKLKLKKQESEKIEKNIGIINSITSIVESLNKKYDFEFNCINYISHLQLSFKFEKISNDVEDKFISDLEKVCDHFDIETIKFESLKHKEDKDKRVMLLRVRLEQ